MNQSLDRFVEKMIEIREMEKTPVLNWSELKQIALDIGLTEEEWEKVELQFSNHTERAQSFLRYENYDDAIAELKSALGIYPSHTHSLFSLASAYALRWKAKERSEDHKKAVKYCNMALETAPTHELTIKLLSDLKQELDLQSKNARSNSITYISIGLVLLAMAIAVVFFSLFKQTGVPDPDVVSEERRSAEVVTTLSTPEEEISFVGDYQLFDEWGIPVKFKRDKRAKNLEFTVEKSSFNDYSTSFSYNFTGFISSKKKKDIAELELLFELVGENDKVLFSGTKEVISEYSTVHRVGDLAPIDFMDYHDKIRMPQFKEVRISVSKIITELSAEKYDPSPIKKFTWKNGRPNNFDVEIRERLSATRGGFSNSFTHEMVLEFKNTGNLNIEGLEYTITWWTKDGKAITSDPMHVTIGSYPKIYRGQTRLEGGTYIKNGLKYEDFDRYTIEILNIK